MLKFWKKKATEASFPPSDLTWDEAATQLLARAVVQAPVPALLRQRLQRELKSAAEAVTQAAGRTRVTTEDLVAGIMAKMPEKLRAQFEEAAEGGPEQLRKLMGNIKNSNL